MSMSLPIYILISLKIAFHTIDKFQQIWWDEEYGKYLLFCILWHHLVVTLECYSFAFNFQSSTMSERMLLKINFTF